MQTPAVGKYFTAPEQNLTWQLDNMLLSKKSYKNVVTE